MSYQSNMAGVTLLPKGSKTIAPKNGENGKQPGKDERRAYGNPKIWGVKCHSDVTGNKKNLNVQWNFRPKADSQFNGKLSKKQSDELAEDIGRHYGRTYLNSETRRNFRMLYNYKGRTHAWEWLCSVL